MWLTRGQPKIMVHCNKNVAMHKRCAIYSTHTRMRRLSVKAAPEERKCQMSNKTKTAETIRKRRIPELRHFQGYRPDPRFRRKGRRAVEGSLCQAEDRRRRDPEGSGDRPSRPPRPFPATCRSRPSRPARQCRSRLLAPRSPDRRQVAVGSRRTADLVPAQARRDDRRAGQGLPGCRLQGCRGRLQADQDRLREGFQGTQGRLTFERDTAFGSCDAKRSHFLGRDHLLEVAHRNTRPAEPPPSAFRADAASTSSRWPRNRKRPAPPPAGLFLCPAAGCAQCG